MIYVPQVQTRHLEEKNYFYYTEIIFLEGFFLKFQEHLFFHVKKQKGFLSLKNNCSRSIRY